MAPEEEELELENPGPDLEESALIGKLLSRVAWGLKTPFVGRKAGKVIEASEKLEDLGIERKEQLASAVGTEKALEISLIEEITE